MIISNGRRMGPGARNVISFWACAVMELPSNVARTEIAKSKCFCFIDPPDLFLQFLHDCVGGKHASVRSVQCRKESSVDFGSEHRFVIQVQCAGGTAILSDAA